MSKHWEFNTTHMETLFLAMALLVGGVKTDHAPILKAWTVEKIKEWEGFEGTPYLDVGGVYRNGYGTKAERPTEIITKATAHYRLIREFNVYYVTIQNRYPQLKPNQVCALTSLYYNTGYIGKRLHKALETGVGVEDIWLRYIRADGKVLNGLVKRRAEEIKLFKIKI